MAREGVSPVEIAPPPAVRREARDVDTAVGRGPSSMASPVGSEVRAPPEAEARVAPRADHERERVDEEDSQTAARWDEVLERLARVDRDLDAFVARRDGGDADARLATTLATRANAAARADDANDATPRETHEPAARGVHRALLEPTSRGAPDDATDDANDDTSATERETAPPPASRRFVAGLAASMTSSLEGHASAAEVRAARAEALAAVRTFYDALLERIEQRSRSGPAMHKDADAPPPPPPPPPPPLRGETFGKSCRGDDVANLRRLLETL